MGFSGTEGEWGQQSLLTPEQERFHRNVVNKASQGSFDPAVDYYKGLLSDDSADMDAYTKPEMRRFNEQIIPGLSEQFAGMGAGGLSSSGFRNSAVQAGTDLSERLGAIRAELRRNAAQGLMQFGQTALNPTTENFYQPGQEGYGKPLLTTAGTVAGTAIGGMFGGPAGAMAGGAVGGAAGGAAGGYFSNANNLYQQSNSVMG